MRKLSLNVDTLVVHSFTTDPIYPRTGLNATTPDYPTPDMGNTPECTMITC
jgi:hypothetical protein